MASSVVTFIFMFLCSILLNKEIKKKNAIQDNNWERCDLNLMTKRISVRMNVSL